ncbi:MAG: RNA 2',3'-cyclic phosphodiesterase [bacterium]|nr:RNA 2',3'-cyclic phosphodiesterase [bacterium]
MRLFVALDLPAALKADLGRLKLDIRYATWVRPGTHHLTLRFLGGAVDEQAVPRLADALSAITVPPFDLTVQGVGRFPPSEKKAARVLWAGTAPSPALFDLHGAVAHAAQQAGFPLDGTPYHPHITLARLKSFKADPRVETFLNEYATFRAEPFRADSFVLFSSALTPQGAQYTPLHTFPLKG